jgi:hypothetical protein
VIDDEMKLAALHSGMSKLTDDELDALRTWHHSEARITSAYGSLAPADPPRVDVRDAGHDEWVNEAAAPHPTSCLCTACRFRNDLIAIRRMIENPRTRLGLNTEEGRAAWACVQRIRR